MPFCNKKLRASPNELMHGLGECAAVRSDGDSGRNTANPDALVEFLVHAVQYLLPAVRGGRARGLPTAHSAPPLKDLLVGGDDDLVWPDPDGDIRGESLEPIHKQVPYAARRDTELYKVLAAVDGIRAGRARERTLAAKYLKERFDVARA